MKQKNLTFKTGLNSIYAILLTFNCYAAGGGVVGDNCKAGQICDSTKCNPGLYCDSLQTPCRCATLLYLDTVQIYSLGHVSKDTIPYEIFNIIGINVKSLNKGMYIKIYKTGRIERLFIF